MIWKVYTPYEMEIIHHTLQFFVCPWFWDFSWGSDFKNEPCCSAAPVASTLPRVPGAPQLFQLPSFPLQLVSSCSRNLT